MTIASRITPVGTATLLRSILAFGVLSGLCGVASADLVTRSVDVTLIATDVQSYDLDVDLNGTIDFTFTAAFVPDPFLSVGFDVIDFPFNGNNGVVIDAQTSDGFPTASRLASGDTVSASDSFSFASFDQANLFFFTSFDPPSGNFEGRTGFVGLRFDRDGETVFGFAQVTVNGRDAAINPLGLTIGIVGYDDVAGRSVAIPAAVPEPMSLIMTGLGAAGLMGYRSRRRAGV